MKEKLIEQLQPIADKYFSHDGLYKVEVRIGDKKLLIHIELGIYNLISRPSDHIAAKMANFFE